MRRKEEGQLLFLLLIPLLLLYIRQNYFSSSPLARTTLTIVSIDSNLSTSMRSTSCVSCRIFGCKTRMYSKLFI
jgi:hypothetical protein